MRRPRSLKQRYGRLLSCTLRCDGLGFDDFLAAAAGQPRFYWAKGGDDFAFAAMGSAVELMAWGAGRFQKIAADARELFATAHIEGAADALTGPLLFGGFSFRSDFTPDNTWSIYAPAHFVLPHYQLLRAGRQTWLRINAQIPPDEDPAALTPDLEAALRDKIAELQAGPQPTPAQTASKPGRINYPMDVATWRAMVQDATGRIHAGKLNKVVLARAAELRFAQSVDPLPVLRHLARDYRDCYRFLFEPRTRFAFYGASPELLADVRARRITTMGLAGSIGRGLNAAADRSLSQALLRSQKDLHEHQIVVRKIRQRLSPFVQSLHVPAPDLLKLHNIQHLRTPMSGRLRQRPGILPLVQALHPTPALGGDPRAEAMAVIRDLEPIPRGWYGAPVGWINADLDGQFTAAIRSAVAQDARVWIYAGAGIVADSAPDLEWDETALKLRPMLAAHGE